MISNQFDSLGRVAVIALSLSAAVFASGCKPTFKLIDHLSVKPSADLLSVRISLVFSNNIQTNMAGSFTVANYGFLFVNPYSNTEPFEVGFSLDTAIFNDQNFIKLTPTQLLPNGLPIGMNFPVVQLQGANPIGSQFDLYGYVDVLHQSWLGMAAMFGFINDQYFPNGLTISQVFLRDSAGDPGVVASVFGPTLDGAGHMIRGGGIALFANVRQLLSGHGIGVEARAVTFRPEPLPIVSGPRAVEYEGQYAKLRGLESSLVRAFNSK